MSDKTQVYQAINQSLRYLYQVTIACESNPKGASVVVRSSNTYLEQVFIGREASKMAVDFAVRAAAKELHLPLEWLRKGVARYNELSEDPLTSPIVLHRVSQDIKRYMEEIRTITLTMADILEQIGDHRYDFATIVPDEELMDYTLKHKQKMEDWIFRASEAIGKIAAISKLRENK